MIFIINNMPSIGIAIPCYHGHVRILKNLLDSIENQTRKPDMVVVSCSGVTPYDIPYQQGQYSFPLLFYVTIEKKNSAQNRNIAASKLDTDIISFMDADDTMHPQRLEIIEKAFKENNVVMLLHSFLSDNSPFELYNISNIAFDIGKLTIHPWGYGAKHAEKNNVDIHNGHCTVIRYILDKIQYKESPDNHGKEDSVYTADIIRMFPDITAYCILPLTRYGSSSATYSYVA